MAPDSFFQTPQKPLPRLLRNPQIGNTHMVGHGKVGAVFLENSSPGMAERGPRGHPPTTGTGGR